MRIAETEKNTFNLFDYYFNFPEVKWELWESITSELEY